MFIYRNYASMQLGHSSSQKKYAWIGIKRIDCALIAQLTYLESIVSSVTRYPRAVLATITIIIGNDIQS